MRGESGRAFIGVDVGTTSARAGIFDRAGTMLATARHPIEVWHEPGDIVEQSSEDIWQACATAIRAAMAEAKLPPEAIGGIGFDATCSLVALGDGDRPLSVSRSGAPSPCARKTRYPARSGEATGSQTRRTRSDSDSASSAAEAGGG